MKILIVGVAPYSLLHFRGDLIKELIHQNHEVVTMGHNASEAQINELMVYGVRYIEYSVSRTGLNPFLDIGTLFMLVRHFLSESPDCVLSYTIKPVIWGSIASRLFPKIKFVGMVTGLGYAFGEGGILRSFVRFVASVLYRFALANAKAVIFQNKDNRRSFIDQNLVSASKTHVVQGSGINLEYFPYDAYRSAEGVLCFLMVSRLLEDKGVREFLAAAQRVKAIWPDVDFVLIGPEETSPNAVSLSDIMVFVRAGVISYKGAVNDVHNSMINSSVYVLPSYHEGMPRTVLEAMAIGRPIITTDVPGCRETVVDGVNGWLVPKGNSDALYDKMIWFINAPNRIQEMGRKSRDMAVKKFDVKQVNKEIISIIMNV